jgi:hypothetical protein
MDDTSTPAPAGPATSDRSGSRATTAPLATEGARPDRLAAEVRESLVLLTLSVLVTVGFAGGASALLTVLS